MQLVYTCTHVVMTCNMYASRTQSKSQTTRRRLHMYMYVYVCIHVHVGFYNGMYMYTYAYITKRIHRIRWKSRILNTVTIYICNTHHAVLAEMPLTMHQLQWTKPQSLPCTLPLYTWNLPNLPLSCNLPILLTLSPPPPVTGPASPTKVWHWWWLGHASSP